jgi:hypothetical protein
VGNKGIFCYYVYIYFPFLQPRDFHAIITDFFQVLTVSREILEDGKCEGWGISLRHLDMSRNGFDNLRNGDAVFQGIFNGETLDREFPMALDSELDGGSLVVSDQSGPMSTAGCKKSDVIIKVKLLAFADGREMSWGEAQKKFKDLDRTEVCLTSSCS